MGRQLSAELTPVLELQGELRAAVQGKEAVERLLAPQKTTPTPAYPAPGSACCSRRLLQDSVASPAWRRL